MKPRLRIVPPAEPSPAEKVRQRVKRMPKPSDMVQCHRCGGREVIETKTGLSLKDGKASGGTRGIICATCMWNGQRVVLL